MKVIKLKRNMTYVGPSDQGHHFIEDGNVDIYVSDAKVVTPDGKVFFLKEGGIVEPSYATARKFGCDTSL
jgi:hypothetical protein